MNGGLILGPAAPRVIGLTFLDHPKKKKGGGYKRTRFRMIHSCRLDLVPALKRTNEHRLSTVRG